MLGSLIRYFSLSGVFMENQIEKHIEFLKSSVLFRDFNDYEIERFLQNNEFKIVELVRGELLKIEGDKSIFVLDGSVATYENGEDGVKTFICSFEPETNIMIPVWKRSTYPTVTVEARKKSVVLLLESDSFLKINSNVIILQNKIQQNIIEMLFCASDDIVQRTRANAESVSRNKIIKYIRQLMAEQQSDTVQVPFTRQELADHLYMDISTLMRELKNLQEADILKYEGKQITVLKSDI